MNIAEQISLFLSTAGSGNTQIDKELIEELGERCKAVVIKQLLTKPEEKFRIRISNMGRPLCQLQKEYQNADKLSRPYNQVLRSLFGDITEAIILVLLKASTVDLQDHDIVVCLDLDGFKIKGTADVTIGSKVYDIKSASSVAFNKKFASFRALEADDTFGYIDQLIGYSVAQNLEPGGWIVVNKETGEIRVLEFPPHYNLNVALEKLTNKIEQIPNTFEKLFTDKEEIFRKKPTGNRILASPCKYCDYRASCWPTLTERPSLVSGAYDKNLEFYTYIDPKWLEENEDKGHSED